MWLPGVHEQALTGDRPRPVGAEEQRRLGDVLDRRDLPQRHRRSDLGDDLGFVDAAPLRLTGDEPLHRRAPHPRRHDHVDPDAPRAELLGQVEHCCVQRALRRRVRGLLRAQRRDALGLRADEHDRSAGVTHGRGGRRHHVHGADHIGGQDALPFFVAGDGETAHHFPGRHLHDAVDRAKAVDRNLRERRALLGVADIGRKVGDAVTGGIEFGGDRGQRVGGAGAEDDVGAVAQRQARGRAPETRTDTGDDDRLAFQHRTLSPGSPTPFLAPASVEPHGHPPGCVSGERLPQPRRSASRAELGAIRASVNERGNRTAYVHPAASGGAATPASASRVWSPERHAALRGGTAAPNNRRAASMCASNTCTTPLRSKRARAPSPARPRARGTRSSRRRRREVERRDRRAAPP